MEYLDIYDKNGLKTGEKEEKELTHKNGLIHKTIHLCILNDKNELLLQRRSDDNSRYPGMLEISVAGHIRTGEDSVEAIQREAFEEIGIRINPYFLEYLFSYKHQRIMKDIYINNEISDVYIYRYNVDINECSFNDKAVSELKYINWKKVEQMWKNKHKELINHEEHYEILFCMLRKYIIKN